MSWASLLGIPIAGATYTDALRRSTSRWPGERLNLETLPVIDRPTTEEAVANLERPGKSIQGKLWRRMGEAGV